MALPVQQMHFDGLMLAVDGRPHANIHHGGQALVRAGLELPGNPLADLIGGGLYGRLAEDLNRIAVNRSERPGLPEVVAHCLCEAPY